MLIKNTSPVYKLAHILQKHGIETRQYHIGKILTIIDASIIDRDQRKALKDIITQAFYDNNSEEMDKADDILNQFRKKFMSDSVMTPDEANYWGYVEVKVGKTSSQNYFPDNN